MRALRGCGWLATCLAFSLLVPPLALAGNGRAVTRAGDLAGFSLRGSDGYAVQVLTIGRRFVVLSASKGHVGAVYSTRGRISGNRIRARFGNLGRISVRFHPSSHCSGATAIEDRGTFWGVIRFSGEHHYTSVDARSARGFAIRPGRDACEGGHRARSAAALPTERLTTHLAAVSKRSGRVVSVDVLGSRQPRLWVQASTLERRGKMEVRRVAYAVVGGPNAFLSSGAGEHPAFAILRPPKPFSGTGAFEEGADLAQSWTGSLAVWLPGAGKVRLAGPRFASSFCRRPSGDSGCALFPPVQRRVGFAQPQGSGSQSQALRDTRLSWSR
jgi:hypothetical protein